MNIVDFNQLKFNEIKKIVSNINIEEDYNSELVKRYIEVNSDIEKNEINIFKNELNSYIQRLSLEKEEVIRIVESLYK